MNIAKSRPLPLCTLIGNFSYIFVYCFSCRYLVELGLRQLGLPGSQLLYLCELRDITRLGPLPLSNSFLLPVTWFEVFLRIDRVMFSRENSWMPLEPQGECRSPFSMQNLLRMSLLSYQNSKTFHPLLMELMHKGIRVAKTPRIFENFFKGVQTIKCKLWTETLEYSGLKVPNSRFALHGWAPHNSRFVRLFCL